MEKGLENQPLEYNLLKVIYSNYSLSPAVAAVAETAPGKSVLTPGHTQSV